MRTVITTFIFFIMTCGEALVEARLDSNIIDGTVAPFIGIPMALGLLLCIVQDWKEATQ